MAFGPTFGPVRLLRGSYWTPPKKFAMAFHCRDIQHIYTYVKFYVNESGGGFDYSIIEPRLLSVIFEYPRSFLISFSDFEHFNILVDFAVLTIIPPFNRYITTPHHYIAPGLSPSR